MIHLRKEKDGAETRSTAMPDAELAQAARRGDKRAFVEIVARHQAMVCGITLGILGDFAASEDAAQEAFLTAWRKIHELREPERLRGWLAQIARNAALGHLRAHRKCEVLDDTLDVIDEAPGPDDAVASKEESTLVRESLARLPETYRLPLILFYREGQSVRAVAEALGISDEAVKQRLARGREMLRDRMAGLVESVLTRNGPTAVFTMAIATAIGALASPAAVAGSVFSAASVSGTTAGSATSTASFVTAMSASKTILIAAAFVTALCIPVGYQLATRQQAVANKSTASRAASDLGAGRRPSTPHFENSTLFAEWRELHEKYGTNGPAMPVLYHAITAIKDPFRRRAFRTALVAEWVEVDAAGGLAFFTKKGADENHARQFLEEWLSRDATNAIASLLASKRGWEEMARECLPEIARRLPSRLVEVVSRLPQAQHYFDSNVRDAFAIIAERGLASARSAAESVTGPSREQALAGVAQVWARSDFEAAVAWVKKLPDGVDRDELIRAALLGKAAIDPVAALELAGTVPSGGRYAHGESTTGARVLIEVAKTDFDATVSWLASHPARFAREDLMGLSRVVTERLNADAAGFLSTHAANGSLSAVLPAVESALLNSAAGQKAAVWDWLKTQPETEATTLLRREVANYVAFDNPTLALEMVADVPNDAAGDALVQNLAKSLFKGGYALSRFDSVYKEAPERLRQPLIEAACHFLCADNLDDPQKWIDRVSKFPEASRAKGMEAVARAWTQQTPEEAVAWAGSLPVGEARNGADAVIASTWAVKDARGAAEWVTSLPAGAERDRTAGSLVAAIAERFPQEAWHWALSIEDPAERARAASSAAKFIAAQDPGTARQWIETGPFTPEVKAELQSTVAKRATGQVNPH